MRSVSTDGIPSDVARFLREDVESVRQLDALLLLSADAARPWRAEQVSGELRCGLGWTVQQLEDLAAKGLVEHTAGQDGQPAYRYAPRDHGLQTIVATVTELYQRRKTAVISLIFGEPSRDSARAFSDAFRLRRED
jgi:predicted ArsR family transcriptional regulator